MTKMTRSEWTKLAKYLTKQSREICKMNGCKGDEHNCESYAYIRNDGALLDICGSDYFQGSSKPVAAVSLPWRGCGKELRNEVEEQAYDEQ
jgi:hypothetical protein